MKCHGTHELTAAKTELSEVQSQMGEGLTGLTPVFGGVVSQPQLRFLERKSLYSAMLPQVGS